VDEWTYEQDMEGEPQQMVHEDEVGGEMIVD
jgi:hypothetical protein